MKVIKRDGREVNFDRNKIISAIGKANSESHANHEKTLSAEEIKNIAYLNKRLHFIVATAAGEKKEFYSENGIADFIKDNISKPLI